MQPSALRVERRAIRSYDLRIILSIALVIVLSFVAMYALARESGPDWGQHPAMVYP